MSDAAQTLTVVIPLRVKPRGGRKAMVTPGVLALERRQDITLIKAVARAFRWRRMLETGRFGTINELAAAEKINPSYVSRVLRLTLLAPDIVEAILDGRQPEGMTLPGLMKPIPPSWKDQRSIATAWSQRGGHYRLNVDVTPPPPELRGASAADGWVWCRRTAHIKNSATKHVAECMTSGCRRGSVPRSRSIRVAAFGGEIMDNGRIAELERAVWAMADTMRGHYKQNQYGRFILPLMVLRRLDCALEPHREAIQQAAASVPEDVDQATRDEHILEAAGGLKFYNTSRISLSAIHAGEPEHVRDGIIEWVSAFSPDVRDVLLNRFKLAEKLQELCDKDILFSLVSSVVALDLRVRRDGDLAAPGASNAEMGTLFEHLIRRFSEAENAEAGEHFTPPDVVRLIADVLVSADTSLLTRRGIVRDIYDPTCGTGRMLTVAEERIRAMAPGAVINLFGQELNEESYGICKADMLMKGHDPGFIRQGNTLTQDRHRGQRFHYMMANPPFGGSWKKEAPEVEREARQHGGRFSAGLPRRTDGQMLFLLHMLSKMRPEGSRIGIVMNGSPLFAGSAGQGENRIRRWIMENDWLEAIIALPEQMFYNTSIGTYVWVLANRKPSERAGLVQLIDASGPRFWMQMPKGLGDKRRYLPDKSVEAIVELYAHLGQEGPLREFSKLQPTEAFGYRRIAVTIPTFDGSEECLVRLRASLLARGWHNDRADAAVAAMASFPASARRSLKGFDSALRSAERSGQFGRKLTAVERKDILSAVQEEDTEQVPLLELLEDYIAREVQPFAPGAELNASVVDEKDGSPGIVGYEVHFASQFRRSRTHRPLDTIDSDIRALSREIAAALEGVLA